MTEQFDEQYQWTCPAAVAMTVEGSTIASVETVTQCGALLGVSVEKPIIESYSYYPQNEKVVNILRRKHETRSFGANGKPGKSAIPSFNAGRPIGMTDSTWNFMNTPLAVRKNACHFSLLLSDFEGDTEDTFR